MKYGVGVCVCVCVKLAVINLKFPPTSLTSALKALRGYTLTLGHPRLPFIYHIFNNWQTLVLAIKSSTGWERSICWRGNSRVRYTQVEILEQICTLALLKGQYKTHTHTHMHALTHTRICILTPLTHLEVTVHRG